MDRQQRQMLRIAAAIHDRYVCQQHNDIPIELPDDAWRYCLELVRQIDRAGRHGWHGAAGRLRRELAGRLDLFRSGLKGVLQRLQSPQNRPSFASVQDIYRDILALHDEFDDVSWDLRVETLSVTTPDIVLEGIFLGPFEIRLDFSQLTGPEAYRVVALDAHPAASDESVTHPHVQSEQPCEGEARAPIRLALQEGRIADFFLIVLNLLNTYNSASPFVSLEKWEGLVCPDCGANVSEENRISCENCGSEVCDDCYLACPSCSRLYCSQCVETCSGCDESACKYCMKPCSKCGERLCPNCLSEKGICETCHEQDQEEDQPADRSESVREGSAAAVSDATVPAAADQPDRLGQVAVPA